jgi:hypothetical protein
MMGNGCDVASYPGLAARPPVPESLMMMMFRQEPR